MATAKIAAGLVLTAGSAKQVEIEERCALWLDGQIAKVQAEPEITGPFWRRTITHLTLEQATEKYHEWVQIPHTRQWWDEIEKPNAGLGFAKKVQQLAREAMSSGDGFVILDADEVRFLGLGVAT